jgi:hypothetical protein
MMYLRRWPSVFLLVLATALALVLSGCIGGGGSSSSKSKEDDGLPRLSFFSDQQFVNAGQAVPVGLRLDPSSTENISAALVAVSLPAGSFVVPPSVTIPAGAGEAVVNVAAQAGAQPGDRVEIQLATGAGYRLKEPSRMVVRVPDEPLPLVSLLGGDAEVSSGGAFFFNVQRTACANAVTVPLVRSGSLSCFDVPDAVSLAAGFCTQSFFGTVDSGCSSGWLTVSILPPQGYAVPAITLDSAGLDSSPADGSSAVIRIR